MENIRGLGHGHQGLLYVRTHHRQQNHRHRGRQQKPQKQVTDGLRIPGLPGTPLRDLSELSKPLPRIQYHPLSSAFLDAVYVGPRCPPWPEAEPSPRLGQTRG